MRATQAGLRRPGRVGRAGLRFGSRSTAAGFRPASDGPATHRMPDDSGLHAGRNGKLYRARFRPATSPDNAACPALIQLREEQLAGFAQCRAYEPTIRMAPLRRIALFALRVCPAHRAWPGQVDTQTEATQRSRPEMEYRGREPGVGWCRAPRRPIPEGAVASNRPDRAAQSCALKFVQTIFVRIDS